MQKAPYNCVASQPHDCECQALYWLRVERTGNLKCMRMESQMERGERVFTHIYLFILNYMWFFSISISPGFPPALLLLSLNIHISLLSFLNKNTISGFLYVKTMTKWFYSQFWKWLNLTTIVFYDNLCFHVPGLLLYQHFFFFFLPQIWTLSYLCIRWKQIPSPGIHFHGEKHVSLKSPDLTP